MNWLALSPFQVTAVWLAASGLALWIYLHNRRPVHRRIATLRFWANVSPGALSRRRRLLDPWAFLAQILFLLLLILALANIRFEGRLVVIVLDTSIWSQVSVPGKGPSIDRIRQEAQRVLNELPAGDQVLLMSTEPDSTVIQQFTSDRSTLSRAIAKAQPFGGVADIPRALGIGRGALTGSQRGLLVYVGPGILADTQERELNSFRQVAEGTASTVSTANTDQPQFLVRLTDAPLPFDNRGITRLSVRRDPATHNLWHLLTQLKNYNPSKASVTLKLTMNGTSLGEKVVPLAGSEQVNVETAFLSAQGGIVQGEISPADALNADNRVAINLLSPRPVRMALIAPESPVSTDLLRAVKANPYLQTEVVHGGESPRIAPDVAIYESSNLPEKLAYNSIWFLKGKGSPSGSRLRVSEWNSQHPVTQWVHTNDVTVRNVAPIQILPTDTVLATVEGNPPAPLIVAREQNGYRLVLVGFDPDNSNFALQSAFPLVIAGAIEWMTHPVDELTESLTTGEVDMPGPATRIISPTGKNIPFTPNGSNLHLLANDAGIYRVISSDGETQIPVNVPALSMKRLVPTQLESAAVARAQQGNAWDMWRWLLALAIPVLCLEWWLYAFSQKKRRLADGSYASRAGAFGSGQPNVESLPKRTEDRSPKEAA